MLALAFLLLLVVAGGASLLLACFIHAVFGLPTVQAPIIWACFGVTCVAFGYLALRK